MLRRAALLTLLLVLAAPARPSGAAGGHGSVYVTTLPPGATVWMDGRYFGETPLFVDDVQAGHHVILLTRSGWQPVRTTTDVNVGGVSYVSAVLGQTSQARPNGTAPKGALQIRDAQGYKVWVDGVAVASFDQPLTLAAGDHILAVAHGSERSASGFHVYPQTITTISLAAQAGPQMAATQGGDELGALEDYVPASDFVVNGDDITIHYRGFELECAVGSLTYTMNGKTGTLSVAPAMVGDKPYLPISLLEQLAKGQT